jgi:hypothetical protein
MKKTRAGKRLELRLLKMPFEQMLRALMAIDDLDVHLLARIETEGTPQDFQLFQSRLAARRKTRWQFVELRVQLEAEATGPSFGAKYDSNPSIH